MPVTWVPCGTGSPGHGGPTQHACARLVALATLALFLGVTACVTTTSGGGSRQSQSDVIAAAELEQLPDEDLFTLIQRIRPTWLQTRAALTTQGSANVIVVVVDGMPEDPGLDPLRGLRAGAYARSALNPSWNATVPCGMGPSSASAKKASGGTPSCPSPAGCTNPKRP